MKCLYYLIVLLLDFPVHSTPPWKNRGTRAETTEVTPSPLRDLWNGEDRQVFQGPYMRTTLINQVAQGT